MSWPDELPRLRDFVEVALHWDEFKKEFERLRREDENRRRREQAETSAREKARREKEAREAAALEVAERQAREVKEALAMEVYELDKVFPKDPDTVRYELLHGEPFEYRVKVIV